MNAAGLTVSKWTIGGGTHGTAASPTACLTREETPVEALLIWCAPVTVFIIYVVILCCTYPAARCKRGLQ
jgi:hypothetical protein